MMVHVPLALAGGHPKNALVICFGMGTSFRSALSWGIPVTAVELVPSVPGLVGFYHENGPEALRSPNARVVIDDGRRFLERTSERWDLIAVDPPPPIEAAGSSLLYSKEFCALVRSRLAEGGVFAQWLPEGDEVDFSAVARALSETFPQMRAFPSYEGWGLHFLASEQPLRNASPDDLAARLPIAAQRDLMEWWPGVPVSAPFARILGKEVLLSTLLAAAPGTAAISDDRPVNEYYLLRMLRHRSPAGRR
jgi:spermidine synthase